MNLDEPYGLSPSLNINFMILSITVTLVLQGNPGAITQLRKDKTAYYHVCCPSLKGFLFCSQYFYLFIFIHFTLFYFMSFFKLFCYLTCQPFPHLTCS